MSNFYKTLSSNHIYYSSELYDFIMDLERKYNIIIRDENEI